MFRSAALKLTAWYMLIIMVLSLASSLVIYQLSRAELVNNTRRQVYFFNEQLEPSDFLSFSALRQRQLDQGLTRLKEDLLLFNLLVFFGGGIVSYGLARRTLQPIEEALEAQKRFTADASHELRTPLTAMQTEIEVALRNRRLSKDSAVQQLKSNLEEVDKLKALSDGLLALALTDKSEKTSQKISLNSAAKQAISQWQTVAETKKIKINTKLREVNTQGDYQNLVDLASILIDNAIKYSPRGGKITVSTSKKGREALLVVADRGLGIAASELPRIFERFYRTDASRSKTNSEGYGLGLAIAKKIAERHGGSIEVKSAPGKGSVFTLRLEAV